MTNILIVEDDILISKQLKKIAEGINSEITVITTYSGIEALKIIDTTDIHAFFLDIDLVDITGFELAKKIRYITKYEFSPIVFVTAIFSREIEAFKEIHCYDYIIKPFTEKEIEIVFRKILVDYIHYKNEKQINNDEKLQLHFKSHTQIIQKKNIAFVEYRNRRIIIGLLSEEIEYIHLPLKKIKKLLSSNFIQVHQSVLINKNYVENVDYKLNEISLNGISLKFPIGRSYKTSVRRCFDELL